MRQKTHLSLAAMSWWRPEYLFSHDDVGFVGNPAKFSAMFTTAQASTAIAAIGDPIGLIKPLNDAENVAIFDGSTSCGFSTASTPAVSLAGDLRVEINCAPRTPVPASTQSLLAKWNTGANQRSYFSGIQGATGLLRQIVSADGTSATQIGYNSTIAPAVVADQRISLAYDLDVDNGANSVTVFETSLDGVAWTQLGAPVTGAVASIHAGSALLNVGTTGTGADSFIGRIYSAELRNASDVLVASCNVADYTSGSTFVSSDTGETWTLNGTVVIAPEGSLYQTASANRPLLGGLPRGGRTNLILYSEDLTQTAGWTADALGEVVINATSFRETANVTTHNISTSLGVMPIKSGVSYTGTTRLKKGVLASAPDIAQITFSTTMFPADQYVNVNLSTGAITATGAGGTASITAGPNGSWDVSLTATATATTSSGIFVVVLVNNNPTAGRNPSYAGSTTADVQVLRTMVRETSASSAYQKVTAAYDITEAGKPTVYLPLFDGSNDALITGLIEHGTTRFFAGGSDESTLIVYGCMGATANCTLWDNTNLRITYTASTGVIAVTNRGGSANLTATTITWGEMFIVAIRFDGATLQAYLNTLTPQVLSAGGNADAATVAILGAQNAASPTAHYTGWLLDLCIDRALTDAELAPTIKRLAQIHGATLV